MEHLTFCQEFAMGLGLQGSFVFLLSSETGRLPNAYILIASAVIKDMEARKRKRPSGGALCRQKKSRRLLAYVPCTDHERKIEQMASLATALTSIGVAFNDSLAYGLAPRSANRAVNEKGGMQVINLFFESTSSHIFLISN